MALPRDAIGLSEGDLDRWMHRVYPATRGPGSVLSHFVVSTVAYPGPPGGAAAVKLGEAGSTLLAGTLLDDGDLTGTDAADDMRAHVIGYMRAHLDDPQLSRSSIAAAHHMSARTLDRLFADQPWSVSGLIRRERLEAVRRDLEDPLLRHRSVAALAARWASSTRPTSVAYSGSTMDTRRCRPDQVRLPTRDDANTYRRPTDHHLGKRPTRRWDSRTRSSWCGCRPTRARR